MVKFRTVATACVSVTAAAALVLVVSSRSTSAQSGASTAAYPLFLTPERADAMLGAAAQRLRYVPGEVLVKFKSGVGIAGQTQALRALRSRPSPSDLRWIGGVALLRDSAERDATILASQLKEQPEVAYAEPNYIYRMSVAPNDPGYVPRQWNLTALDMPRVWDMTSGGSAAVTVAVVDSGSTTAPRTYVFQTWNGRAMQNVAVPFGVNPDLAVKRIVSPHDFAFWDGPVLDMVGHGTHVASTIGEDTDNALADAGIAYKVKLMPVKVCVGYWEFQFVMSAAGYRQPIPPDAGGCPTDAVADGIRYAADNGAKVINLSLGGPDPSTTVRDAMTYAVGKGAFIAIAMGNEYEDGNAPSYPAVYAAALEGAMSVGAVGRSLNRSFYSNTGSHIEIAAPGGDDRDGGGDGMIWQATLSPSDSDPTRVASPRFDRYAEVAYEGTSMATPHVAGVAALIIGQGVTRPVSVERLITQTARFLGKPGLSANRNDEYGFGLVQPRAALRGSGFAR
jgi:serine protease